MNNLYLVDLDISTKSRESKNYNIINLEAIEHLNLLLYTNKTLNFLDISGLVI